jgi:hypothetical protein
VEPSSAKPMPSNGTPGKTPRAGQRGRPSAQGAVTGMGVVVALIVAVLLLRNGGVFGLDPFLPAAPPDWRTYHDSLGLFSVRLPATWQAQTYPGTLSYGDATGSASEPLEDVQLSDPSLGEASARLSVNAVPIKSAWERHWYCRNESQRWLSFHGIPTQLFNQTSLIFDTGNAHFQIDLGIPGVTGGRGIHSSSVEPPPTPTPLPAKTVASDFSLLSTILGSFQPTNATPLSCG